MVQGGEQGSWLLEDAHIPITRKLIRLSPWFDLGIYTLSNTRVDLSGRRRVPRAEHSLLVCRGGAGACAVGNPLSPLRGRTHISGFPI